MLSTSKPAWPSHMYGKQDDDKPDIVEHIKKDSLLNSS